MCQVSHSELCCASIALQGLLEQVSLQLRSEGDLVPYSWLKLGKIDSVLDPTSRFVLTSMLSISSRSIVTLPDPRGPALLEGSEPIV